MAIFGLDKTESDMGKKVAFNLANSWVQTNYQGYQLSQHMYEKVSLTFYVQNYIQNVYKIKCTVILLFLL